MEALREHRPAPTDDAVHGPRETRADGFHASRERRHVAGLDHKVRVVVQERVVHEAKIAAIARVPEAPLDLVDEPQLAEGRYVWSELHRDVHGVAAGKDPAWAMRDGAGFAGLAPGACAASTLPTYPASIARIRPR